MNFQDFENAFHKMTIDEVAKANAYYRKQGFRDSGETAAVVYLWSGYLGTKIAFYNDCLFSINKWGQFQFPAGGCDKRRQLKFLYEYCLARDKQLVLSPISQQALGIVETVFECESEYRQDYSDYLYNVNDLRELSGKKYHARRNHISKFKSLYPDYRYITICSSNYDRAHEFLRAAEYTGNESETAFVALENLEKLNMFGGMIEANGQIVALSMGEIMGDTLFVHYEKGLKEINGSYAVMNNEFVLHNSPPQVQFVNREEDMGIEGLRKAKLAYYPVGFVNKYIVKVVGS